MHAVWNYEHQVGSHLSIMYCKILVLLRIIVLSKMTVILHSIRLVSYASPSGSGLESLSVNSNGLIFSTSPSFSILLTGGN